MSKVIIFSRVFPANHPKAGQPTYFVEKFLSSINYINNDEERLFNPRLSVDRFGPKHHTIRAGSRWKAGDKFSPRVWSGKPYNSKQIIIAPDIEIKKVWNFEIKNGQLLLGGYAIYQYADVAENDGLSGEDFLAWFRFPKPFTGQIICWSDKIKY